MRLIAYQLIGAFVLRPFMAMPWHRVGRRGRSSDPAVRLANAPRWRLEVYSMDENAVAALQDSAEVSIPSSVVRSAGGSAESAPASWTEPRIELDVDMMDPFADESLTKLLGPDHRVRFVTGNEVVVDTKSSRLRIRRFRFG